MRKLIIMGMVALLALSFGPAHVMAQGKVVRLTLIDENGSGEDGSAQVTDLGNGSTKVELIMLNAPDGAEQPASIHEGSCATLDADVKFTLETVKSSKSTSTVKASLADLTNAKHAIVVVKSASDSTVISCGNMPSAAAVSGGTMTMDQVMTTLLDQANELAGTIGKKEADASQNAYDAYHATFAAHEEEIKAKSADSQAKLEEAMHGVRDALAAGDWTKSATAAQELVDTVKEAQTALAGSAGASSSMETVFQTLETQANDLVRETTNKDAAGAQAAYDDFHTTFAANEDAIKAKNAGAQANIETAMHEVRDAIQASDWTKASAASNELVDTVKEADAMVSGASGGGSLPTSGGGAMLLPVAAGLALLAFGLISLGAMTRRKAAR
jgi:hypothetical protein